MKYKLLRFSLLCILVMLCGGSVFAQDDPLSDRTPAVTLDFTTQANWNIPTSGTNTAEGTFTDGTYSIKLAAATNYKLNNGYLILGKTDSYLELPAFSFDVDYITVEGTSGASADVKQNIFVGETAVSTETTGAKNVTNQYAIASAYQAAGNVYTLKITSNHNTQISKINIYKKVSADDVNQPVITPATGTYTEAQKVSMTCSTTGATIYYTTDGTDPSANNGTEYTESFTVNTTTTVKAIAIKGEKSSNISESVITIPAKPALPWSEDWSAYSAGDAPSKNTPYYSENDSEKTIIYTGSMSAGGESPELLVAKSGGTFTITEIDLSSLGGEAATLALLYNTNSKSLAVTTTTENVTIGDAIKTTDKTYKRNIIIPAGTTTLNLTFSNSTGSNARLDNLSLKVSIAPKEPTFSPAAGTYDEAQSVTITTETDGATIKYSTDGENYSEYTGPISVSETTTITAYAEKDGEESAKVSARYDITVAITSISGLNEAAAAGGSTGQSITYNFTDVNVVYVNEKYNYITDGTNNALLFGSDLGLKAGDKVSGTLTGVAKTYSALPEIAVNSINITSQTADAYTPAATTVTVDQLANNVNNYIKIEGATYVSANNKNLTFKVGETNFTVRNEFDLTVTGLEADKVYDIVGFGSVYNTTYQVYATEITEATSEETTGFRDIKANLTGTDLLPNGTAPEQYTDVSTGVAVAADGSLSRVATDAAEAAAVFNGKWHGTKYGWNNFTASVPVEGCVKITLGASNYGSGAVIVTNSDGDQVAKIDNHTGAMWSTSNPDNVAVGYYRTNSPTTLTFSQCDYIPYFAVEAIAEENLPAEVTVYNVTFAKDADVTGVVPATIEVEAGNKATAPKNTTLYKEGYTLTGWVAEDMTTTYTPGEEITPAADMTLTAVFTQNEVSLADREDAVTVTWSLGEKNGVEGVEYNGTTGIIVTQATVNSNNIDAKLDVDATSAKFTNKNRGDVWAMINANTKLTVPACKNAVIKLTAYQTGYSITAGGNAMTDNGDKTYTYTVTDDVTSIDIVNTAQVYLSHVAVTLPKVEQGGDEPAATDVTATWDWKNLIPSSISSTNIQQANEGDVESDVEGIVLHVISNGGKLAYNSSGYAQFNLNTTIQVPVKNKGDEIVVESFHGQSNYTIGGEDATNQDTYTYTASQSDATKGYVEMIPTKTAYLYSIKVTHFAPAAPTTLDNEPATATFPFNLGTAGQTATFSEGDADYFLNSKVELGANMGYAATRTLGDYTFTKIQPQTANASAAAEDYVLFRIQPKPGFTFTPSAASLVAYKDGTGNGTLTIAFVTADGTETTLATDQAIARNSETPAYTSLAYNDLSAVTPVEGAVGLKVYIGGNLATNKQVGLSNIIIEGTLSGTEKDLPILASFKANGTEYTVDEVFGDLYEADLELSKSESMISESNPLTEITATSGEVGTITYTDATETGCKVTIPVTAGETTLEYILNITQKPDFTLTYIGVDGTTVLNTQTVEKDATIGTFAQDIADVTASKDGYKARGWFKNNYVGEKWATTDVVTADAKLYAIETEIEVSSDSKKYVFDLTDKFFDADDHEAFNPTGSGKWYDAQHGWAFANGDKIDLLVGGKASIIISLCKYAGATTKITASNGAEIAAQVETDGATASIEYDGEPGILTLSFDGTAYIHKLTIFNTTTTNYEKNGDWIIAKAGDASSFLDALDAANGTSGEDPVYIFLPNGTYDLGTAALTNIGKKNISIIGESMEGVVIKNRPIKEGIAITATLQNNSENLYMQDLTLDCVAPYGTGDDTSSAERGVTLHDKGTKTICKNVYLKGLQDTYYCNNTNGQYYFEDGKIEGTVDYICGNGDAYFNKVALFNAKRTNGNSGDVIAAPNTPLKYGYIFNECTIDGVDGQDGQYSLGRPWAANTQVIYLNTTMKIQPLAAGWTDWSPANAVKQFAEYGSVDAKGNPVDTSKRKTTFNDVANAPTLNETQAAAFALEIVFAGWDPAQYTEQVKTTSAKLNGNTLTWAAVDGATMYAIVKNGSIIDLTNQNSYTIADEAQSAKGLGTATDDPTAAGDTYAVRAANGRGGFGEAVVANDATGIDNITTDATGINGTITEVYSMGGARLAAPQKGVNIVKVKGNDGSVKTMKVIVK